MYVKKINFCFIITYTNLIHEGVLNHPLPSLYVSECLFRSSLPYICQWDKCPSSVPRLNFLFIPSLWLVFKTLVHKLNPPPPHFPVSLRFLPTDSPKHKTYPGFPNILKKTWKQSFQCLFVGFNSLQYLTFTFSFLFICTVFERIIMLDASTFTLPVYFPKQYNLESSLSAVLNSLHWYSAKLSGLVCLGPTGLSGVLEFWLSLFFLELCFLIVYVTLFSASSLTTLLTVFGLFCFSSFTCFLILDVSHVLLKNAFFISLLLPKTQFCFVF